MDLRVLDEGTIFIVTPETQKGRDWVKEHLSHADLIWGRDGVVVEHRFIADIVNGAQSDELTVGHA